MAVSQSVFTGQQQVQDWGGFWLDLTVGLPPMKASVAAVWVDFLVSLNGPAKVFQLVNAAILAMVPASASCTGYWALKQNSFKWSIRTDGYYLISFELREAK